MKRNLCQLENNVEMPKSAVQRILNKIKHHPYKTHICQGFRGADLKSLMKAVLQLTAH